jgi:transposase-like protein
MNCPHCTATSTQERAKKTKLGSATSFCPKCQPVFNERTGTLFNSLEFPTDVVGSVRTQTPSWLRGHISGMLALSRIWNEERWRMNCPSCDAAATRKRAKKTELGYAIFFCSACWRTFNERTNTLFNSLEVPTDVVLLVVLWRLRYKLSLRDVAEMF